MSGIAIFGQDCFKIPQIPQVFNNSLEEALLPGSLQASMAGYINKTFINEDNCRIGGIRMQINPGDFSKS